MSYGAEEENRIVRRDLSNEITRLRAQLAESAAREAVLREALEPLWKYLRLNLGDWYLPAERREHANRIDAALAAPPSSAAAELEALRKLEQAALHERCVVSPHDAARPDPACEVCCALAAVDAARGGKTGGDNENSG